MVEVYTKKEYQYIEEKLGPKLCKLFHNLDAFLAGGAITSIFANQPINDFDIFFRDKDSYVKAVRYFKILVAYDANKTEEICTTERATTFQRVAHRSQIAKIKQEKYGPSYEIDRISEKIIVQLVDPSCIGGSPEAIFMKFDFTICMGAYIFKTREFIFDRGFFKALGRRELIFNAEAANAVSSLFRAVKYKSRGFTMSMGEEMKLAMILGSKKFVTFRDFVNACGSIPTDPTLNHIYNHIRYPDETKTDEDVSLLDRPYNVDEVIGWLDELHHIPAYMPQCSINQDDIFLAVDKQKYQDAQIVDQSLDSDLTATSLKDIVAQNPGNSSDVMSITNENITRKHQPGPFG